MNIISQNGNNNYTIIDQKEVVMKNVVLFMSSKCPECPPIIEKLKENGIEYRQVDISESMGDLREFLKYRDREDFFKPIKEGGMAGVPTLMVDEKDFYNPYSVEDYSIFK